MQFFKTLMGLAIGLYTLVATIAIPKPMHYAVLFLITATPIVLLHIVSLGSTVKIPKLGTLVKGSGTRTPQVA